MSHLLSDAFVSFFETWGGLVGDACARYLILGHLLPDVCRYSASPNVSVCVARRDQPSPLLFHTVFGFSDTEAV